MNTVEVRISDLIPYEKNTKKHDAKQIDNVAASLKEFGFVQPLVIDKDNVIVIGHCRYLAAKKNGYETVPCLRADDLTSDQVRKLRIVDNKTNESPWDMDYLKEELSFIDDWGDFDFDFGLGSMQTEDNPYTQKAKAPQYEITGETPQLFDCYNTDKTNDLIAEIEASSVTDDEKEFLRQAAARHSVFNYKNIAEYYAAASPEMQDLMEKSALVIIDYDDAIANGFLKISESIKTMREDAEAHA